MKTTVSLRQNNTLFCLIRKEFVKNTPEERVRQNTLSFLLSNGFSPQLVVVEKKLSDLALQKTPNRRVDILCYEAGSLQPLLLVECKAKSFGDKEFRQLLGYNFYIQAGLIALVGPEKVQLYTSSGDLLADQLVSYMYLFKK